MTWQATMHCFEATAPKSYLPFLFPFHMNLSEFTRAIFSKGTMEILAKKTIYHKIFAVFLLFFHKKINSEITYRRWLYVLDNKSVWYLSLWRSSPIEGLAQRIRMIFFLFIHSSDIWSVCYMPGRVLSAWNKMKSQTDTDPTHSMHRE